MAGIGGVRPETRDLSRKRDRQAAWVLAAAGAITILFFYPAAVVLGLVAAAYAWGSGERGAMIAAVAVVVLSLFLGIVAGAGGGFDSGLLSEG
jgi:thiamine transporter ThiT